MVFIQSYTFILQCKSRRNNPGAFVNFFCQQVQPYSGSGANFAVYAGVVEPHGRIMGKHISNAKKKNYLKTSLVIAIFPVLTQVWTYLMEVT